MNPIALDSIVETENRSEYNNIDKLAQSILDNGLVQPIVLSPDGENRWHLDAGHRRIRALREAGYTHVFHATTSDPERPGYVLKGEDETSAFSRLKTKIAENLDREDLDWRDEVSLIYQAWQLAQSEAYDKGEKIIMRHFGSTLGVCYANVQAAVYLYKDLKANPEKYAKATGMRAAAAQLVKETQIAATKALAKRSIKSKPLFKSPKAEAKIESPTHSKVTPFVEPTTCSPLPDLDLTEHFKNGNSLDWMESQPGEIFDHIVTDPDYAVSIERLEANTADAALGVVQSSVADSLLDLQRFLPLAHKLLRPGGFLIFFYDLDHHEKLQAWANAAGFSTQRWPLVWHKIDYRANAAPTKNFPKNMEYAMLCRKGTASLVQVQTSSIFACPSSASNSTFHHPFAKPIDVWLWLYSAIAYRGQTTFDPFLGSGTSAVAALQRGLLPCGMELNPDHYHNALINLRKVYGSILT